MFTFDNYVRDYSTAPEWKPGDPWENRLSTLGLDGRDSSLEDHVNADYVRRAFTATVLQNNVALTSTGSRMVTRGARIHVEMVFVIGSVGTIATQIKVTPTAGDLPPGASFAPGSTASMGQFFYLRASVASIITGLALWDGRSPVSGSNVSMSG